MYKRNKLKKTRIKVSKGTQGETIETKIERITQNREPIKDGAPIIYTDRKDGVMPEYDVRTDRWEVAADAMGKVAKMHTAKREERHKPPKEEGKTESKGEGGTPGQTGGNEGKA